MASLRSLWPFGRKTEESRGAGYTSDIISARHQFFSGARGVAEATATVETCVSLWERAFATADVADSWRDIVSPSRLGLMGRSLATRGQFVALIDARGGEIVLTPATDWDVSTRGGEPIAYRLSIPEAGGGHQVEALAGEVIDIRINTDPVTPWHGQSPLRKVQMTGDMLASIESGLQDVLNSPWGAQIVPLPKLGARQVTEIQEFVHRIRSRRGGFFSLESTQVMAGASQAPHGDFDRKNLSPDLRGMEIPAHWEAARNSIMGAYGIPPILFSAGAQSAALREAQRHAVLWTLAPIAKVASAELGRKLGDADLKLNLVTPLQAADSAGRARAVGVLNGAGVPLEEALKMVGWSRQA